MKKIIFFLIALLLIGCTRDYKAQRVVREFIKENFVGQKYKCIRFSPIDSIYTSIYDYPEYRKCWNAIIELSKLHDSDEAMRSEVLQMIRNDQKMYIDYLRSNTWDQRVFENLCMDLLRKNIQAQLDELYTKSDSISAYYTANIKPEFSGYSIAHDFSLTDINGNMTAHLYVYQIDSDFSKVMKFVNQDAQINDNMVRSAPARAVALWISGTELYNID